MAKKNLFTYSKVYSVDENISDGYMILVNDMPCGNPVMTEEEAMTVVNWCSSVRYFELYPDDGDDDWE